MGNRATKFRWFLAFLMFMLNFVSYMDRVNLSVATPAIMQEFGFDKVDMSWFQSAFFLAYAIMQIPGGMMGEYFGHRRVVSLGVLWWSVFTCLTATCSSLASFIGVRFLFGLGEGPIPPTCNAFVYKWYNKAEKAFAYSFNLGGAFIGPVVGPVVTVWLMLAFGWREVFVIFGAMGLLISAAWYYFAVASPRDSKFVNTAEAEWIESGMVAVDPEEKKELAPWKNFLKSSQFWAIGLQYFVADYIMFVFLVWLPVYLVEAQNFSLQKMGMAAALPWAALCVCVLTSGYISDKLVAAGLPKHAARTLFGAAGLVICCATLSLGAVATTPTMNVLWLTISLGSLGLVFSASWAACTDIGGKFSGSVSGWMNFWGNIGGVLAPICTAWIATKFGWQMAIIVTAATAGVGVLAWFAVKPDSPLVCQNDRPAAIENGLNVK